MTAPQAFGEAGIITVNGDVTLGENTRIDGMVAQVIDHENPDKTREAGTYIQKGGTLTVNTDKNGWFAGEVNVSGSTATIEVDKLNLTASSGKITVDDGGTLHVTKQFTRSERGADMGVSDNGRLILDEAALLKQSGGSLSDVADWNDIYGLSIKESAVLKVNLEKDKYSSDEVQAIYQNLVSKLDDSKGKGKGTVDLGEADLGITRDANGNVAYDALQAISQTISSNLKVTNNLTVTNDTIKSAALAVAVATKAISASVAKVIANITDAAQTTVSTAGTLTLNGSTSNEALVEDQSGNVLGVQIEDGAALVLGNKTDEGLQGKIGQIIAAGDEAVVSLLGKAAGKATYTVESIQAEKEANQVFVTNSDVTIQKDSAVNKLNLQNGSMKVAGKLSMVGAGYAASTIAGTLTAEEVALTGTAFIGNSTTAGQANMNKLTGPGAIFMDPLWVGNEQWGSGSWLVTQALDGENNDTLKTTLVVGMNSSAVFGADKETAVANAEKLDLTYGQGAVEASVYIGTPIKVDDAAVLYVDGTLSNLSSNQISTETFGTGVALKANTLAMMDVSKANGSAMVTTSKLTLDKNAHIAVFNASADSTVELFGGITDFVKTDGTATSDFDINDAKIVITPDVTLVLNTEYTGGSLLLTVSAKDEDAIKEELPGLLASSILNEVVSTGSTNVDDTNKSIALLSRTASYSQYGYTDVNQAVAATNELTTLAVTSGVYNTAIDASQLMNRSVEQRLSLAQLFDADHGLTLWTDVLGTTNEAKKLYGNSGYDLDLAGIVFGGDVEVATDTRLGVAVTLGTGKGHAKNAVISTKNNADFAGVSLYAAKRMGDFNAQADIGYMHTKSKITRASAYDLNFNDNVGTNAFTAGVRGEYQIPVGSINVIPHIGLRWTHLDVGSYTGGFATDSNKMNIITMPVGVSLAGSAKVSNWVLRPNIDLSINPSLGSKKGTTRVHLEDLTEDFKTRVVDTAPVQLSLGLNAKNGAWTLGASWDLDVGSRDRLNNSLKLKARYSF